MKFRCTVCGYVHEGPEAPEFCPVCKAPKDKFVPVEENKMSWAAEHVVGVAKGVDPEIIEGLRGHTTAASRRTSHRHCDAAGQCAPPVHLRRSLRQ